MLFRPEFRFEFMKNSFADSIVHPKCFGKRLQSEFWIADGTRNLKELKFWRNSRLKSRWLQLLFHILLCPKILHVYFFWAWVSLQCLWVVIENTKIYSFIKSDNICRTITKLLKQGSIKPKYTKCITNNLI